MRVPLQRSRISDLTGLTPACFQRAFCAAGLFLAFGSGLSEVSAQTPERLWSVDLGANPDFNNRLGVLEVELNPPSINFLNNSQIICDFYDAGISVTEPPSAGYHVLEINAKDGRFGRELDFKPSDARSRAVPTEGGDFVVFTGTEIKKFNSGFSPVLSYGILRERVGGRLDGVLIDVAPGGQTMVLYQHAPFREQAQWSWVRTSDFTVVDKSQGPLTLMIQASDGAAIFETGARRELLTHGDTKSICARCSVNFLTDDLVFLDLDNSYRIQSIEGERHGTGKLNIQALHFTRAASATRFAFMTGGYRGFGFPIQTHFNKLSAKIKVIDWTTNKTLAELGINEPVGNPSAGLTQMALALSPDGKLFAVLLHHALSLYRIP